MLLRRSKSGELGKKAQAQKEAELERERKKAAVPKLPEFSSSDHVSKTAAVPDVQSPEPAYSLSPSPIKGFANRPSADAPRNYARPGLPPPPPIPFDPYARTASMTHRGRESYASTAMAAPNSPRRVRRRKDPTPFNVLVVGTHGVGKTCFIEFLKKALALPAHKRPMRRSAEEQLLVPAPASGHFVPHYVETEMDGERVGLTLWDSNGLETNLVDLQLRETINFIESKFEDTFAEEMKVVRSPNVQDTHIHAVFLLLDPFHLDRNIVSARKALGETNGEYLGPGRRLVGALNEDLDLQTLRALHGKTTVVPVIAKADTVTTKHMDVLKRSVWDSIKKAGLDPLEPLGLDETADGSFGRIDEEDYDSAVEDSDEDAASQSTYTDKNRLSRVSVYRNQETAAKPFLPLSIISPDLYEPGVTGRQFSWGFADPYNEEHCDFQTLKDAVFSDWRVELREASREQWYEAWRSSRLKVRGEPSSK
ncbi:hypothetical protein RJ55_05988 [Drechmeria coniospora]|nr:hypothetical protein RJ55_05988 [Drechmeria coniospora]